MDANINMPPGRNPEGPKTPEQKLSGIVRRAEAAVAKESGTPRAPGNRTGGCTFAPDIVDRLIDPLKLQGENIASKTIQINDVHKRAGNFKKDGKIDVSNGFQHAVSVISVDGEKFLVDLTFCQYMNPDGFISSGIVRNGIKNDNPLAQELLTNGYIRLTNESLQEYLLLTSSVADSSTQQTLQGVTLSLLDETPPLWREFKDTELDAMINRAGVS